jgi:hypothetical protein
MEKFNRENSCTKCGSGIPASFVYHEGGGAWSCPSDPHMHRKCGECGYAWCEEPLG